MKYRKLPIVIKAFEYIGDIECHDGSFIVPPWVVEAYKKGFLFYESDGELFIRTLEGVHHVSVGDYIIQGVKDELYACKPDIFKMTYEEII